MNQICNTLLVIFVLTTCMVSNSFSADDELKQLRQWHGKFRIDELRKLEPANHAIMDAESWKALWDKWRPNEELPNIDWKKRIVAVVTVDGPNNMNAHRLELGDDGDLKIIAASTKIGGPGFGFLCVEVDRLAITSIHGVPFTGEKKPIKNVQLIDDSILVEMVGTGKTGIVAIGGESTGVTITSHGLTWELDMRRFRMKMNAIDGKRIAITGKLRVKKGVEIPQRLIVVVHSLKVLPDGDDRVIPPARAAFKKITLQKSGGFAGINITTTVMGNGETTRENERERVTESFDLKADQLIAMHSVVNETDWSEVPAKNITKNAADLFQYNITIETDKKTYEIMVDDMAAQKIPALKKLIDAIE